MLESLSKDRKSGLIVNVLYNCDPTTLVDELSEGINRDYPDVTTFTYKSEYYGIPEARNKLLETVKTPLVAYVDDDCSFAGENTFDSLEYILKSTSLGLIGLPSYYDGTDRLFKPREGTPKEEIDGILYMKVEGMFGASYTQLLRDAKGFNDRKRFWMEWTDLNTKLHRMGYPTGMMMNGGHLCHWFDAPDSATRGRKDRSLHVIFGLLATGIEFDCDGLTSASDKMWDLAEKVYLKYGYGENISPKRMLVDIGRVLPRLVDDWNGMHEYRAFLRELPFSFMPFEELSRKDWETLIHFSKKTINAYKNELK